MVKSPCAGRSHIQFDMSVQHIGKIKCFIDTYNVSERNFKMEMCYDGALVMPKNYAVVNEEEMTYVDGGISAKVRWYGADIHFTSRDLQGMSYALATGSGASWIAAELHAPTVVGGIAWGAIAAVLATCAGASALADWASKGKGIDVHVLWNGYGWITF